MNHRDIANGLHVELFHAIEEFIKDLSIKYICNYLQVIIHSE